MKHKDHIDFLVWALPRLSMRYRGFKRVKRQVCRRIDRRMGELGLSGLDEYRDYLMSNRQEWDILDRFCRIHISRFFRDRRVFQTLIESILPDLVRLLREEKDQTLRVWSLGCASGEEAYTFGMIWNALVQDKFPGLSIHILGTDVDPHMLERARAGVYPKSSLRELPDQWIESGFECFEDGFLLKDLLKKNIEFLIQDVRRGMPPGDFHIIAARNLVFTYYDENLQKDLAQKLIQKLRPNGILILGRKESLPAVFPDLTQNSQCHSIYCKK